MYGQLPLRGPGLGGMASPNTFMKLQNPDMDPDGWFSHDPHPMGVAEMFADLPCDRLTDACMQE